jgi:hypothetical protein
MGAKKRTLQHDGRIRIPGGTRNELTSTHRCRVHLQPYDAADLRLSGHSYWRVKASAKCVDIGRRQLRVHFPELYLVVSNPGPLLAALCKDTQCLRAEKMRLHMRGRSPRFRSRYTVQLRVCLTALALQAAGE